MRENPKADPAGALRERAGRLRNKAQLITKSYKGRQIDDAWSWLLDTAELCGLAADAMTAENQRLRKALQGLVEYRERWDMEEGHHDWCNALDGDDCDCGMDTARAALNHAAPAAEREG